MQSVEDRNQDTTPQPASAAGSSAPSSLLLAAAMMGLLGGGCGGGEQTTGETQDCATSGGGTTATTATGSGGGTTTSGASSGTGAVGAGGSGGAGGATVISETEGNKTFAQIKAECDERGGYTQVTAACSGVNSCAGFSYGDWSPGVTTEHTCAGINGCNGISCVVLPEDSGKTGQEIYEEALPESGPRSCTNCHAVWNEDGPDMTKFKLYLLAGSPRNETNWLDYSPAAQARTVAFGKQGILEDGTAYANMAAYHKVYSRAEIERVVDYIRTQLEVVPTTIKTAD